ncbi:hypothetical protein ACH42_16425 [Endozoicomonas sp. (ex Bugula neritina AB1)]|nr:hypothetical protein ACH42_16425 [Endozoicomonas sp. (ex Bugula neritina AB1)]
MKKSNITSCKKLLATAIFLGSIGMVGPAISGTSALSQGQSSDAFLKGMVSRAEFIFKGTVVDKSEKLSIEGIPYTFVTYNIDEVVSGNYSGGTITLKYVGGQFANGNYLKASNSPDIKVGENSILMVRQSEDTGCDFVECENGRFIINNDSVITASESAIRINALGRSEYTAAFNQQNSSKSPSNVSDFIEHLKSLKQSAVAQKSSVSIASDQTNNSSVTSADIDAPFNAYSGLLKGGAAPSIPAPDSQELTPNSESFDQWELEQLKENDGNPLL